MYVSTPRQTEPKVRQASLSIDLPLERRRGLHLAARSFKQRTLRRSGRVVECGGLENR